MWTTQMDAARKGIATPQMIRAAEKEGMTVDALMVLTACGHAVVPANRHHLSLDATAIGRGISTKINVNLGVSKDACDVECELEKARMAVAMKADAIMDLSSFGSTSAFRRRLIAESPAMIGTVPIYDAIAFYDKELEDITSEDFLRVLEMHAREGVDFVTVHAGLTRDAAEQVRSDGRLLNIVSRGGSLLFSWMALTGRENPFYECFDRVLDICEAHDVTLSLGDACRPGCIHDASDACQIRELVHLGELTKRAWARGVQVMIEGPGHMRIDEIAANVTIMKRICHGAPFYVLGPLVTDVAPGYDHITSAIGGAMAAAAGADFLCYVTPAEHLRLPNRDDVREGIVAARIAAHAGDLGKHLPGADEWDRNMSVARQEIDWERMFTLALEPEKARRYRKESCPHDEDTCTMCGKICAVRTMNRTLGLKSAAGGSSAAHEMQTPVCAKGR